MPKYIVAVPHCYCHEDNPVRHCDRVAEIAADSLVAVDVKKNIAYVQKSDKLRSSDHDYNRPNTDDTPWRARLREVIKSTNPDFIFEVHSFPGDHEMYKSLWPGADSTRSADLCLYESPENKIWIEQFAADIRSKVSADKIIRVVKPWHPVAITDDVSKISGSKKHALIEFNESLGESEIRELAAAVYSAAENLTFTSGGWTFDPAVDHPAAISDGFISGPAVSGKTLFAAFVVGIILLIIGAGALFAYGFKSFFAPLTSPGDQILSVAG